MNEHDYALPHEVLVYRIGQVLLGLILLALAFILIIGCTTALRDRGAIYTEEGLRAAAMEWDAHYDRKLAECASKYEPESEGAERCFGPTYDADADVAASVYTAVMVLRTYWAARAAGKSPDFKSVALEVAKILAGLPPEVRQYFDRVKGVPTR